MGKKSTKILRASVLPNAPIIYLNDPIKDMPHARYVRGMIPDAILALGPQEDGKAENSPPVPLEAIQHHIGRGCFNDRILVAGDNQPDTRSKSRSRRPTMAEESLPSLSTKPHLIPESEMLVTHSDAFPEYAYCPINGSKLQPNNAKILFVGLVTSRPGQRPQWTVADRTGTANLYFQYRDASSQYTWDRVQNLKVDELIAIPRMPMVEIKERKVVRTAKAPVRAAGLAAALVGICHPRCGPQCQEVR
ncbi:hypothetical protein LTR46_011899 [Exophiala xenobiotica]|nr:hypothetical protein LTS06_011999 [Exophiala xenobiotica]KAK5549700.1 hypothetical protein LTR46_011899 [Exophiala xenobiotica]